MSSPRILFSSRIAAGLVLFAVGACIDATGGTGDGSGNDSEVISRVELTFTPKAGGDAAVFSFTDPDGDGGMSGMAETITLTDGAEYELTIRVLNELVDPPVDITAEIREEAEDHLFLVAGDGVVGPAAPPVDALVTHAYDDLESDYGENLVGDDLPVGLANTITAMQAGASELRLMLRHVPPLNGTPQKRAGLPQDFADGKALPGDVDVDVTFALRVM